MDLDGGKCAFGDVDSRLELSQKQCRGANSFQFRPVDSVDKLELPSSDLVVDRRLCRIIKLQAARRELPTVVGATCPRPAFIDRTGSVDEYWTVPDLVAPHQDVPHWEPRCREEHIGWDLARCVHLVGGDVDELRGGTASRASAAGNVGGLSLAYDPLDCVHPGREPPGIEERPFVHLDSASRPVTRPGYWELSPLPQSFRAAPRIRRSGAHNTPPAFSTSVAVQMRRTLAP